MDKRRALKIANSILLALAMAMQIFGLTGLLKPYSSREIALKFNSLIQPYNFTVAAVFILDLAFLLYLLYSAGLIGHKQGEQAKHFVAVADVGLALILLTSLIDSYLWHYGLFGVNILLRALSLVILLRILTLQLGKHKKYLLAKLPFDLLLGAQIYSLFLALATACTAWCTEGALFTPSARAVLIILAMTLTSMVIGLRLKNAVSMLSVLAFEGAIAAVHLAAGTGYDARFPEIYIAAILSMAGLIAAIIVAFIQRRRS